MTVKQELAKLGYKFLEKDNKAVRYLKGKPNGPRTTLNFYFETESTWLNEYVYDGNKYKGNKVERWDGIDLKNMTPKTQLEEAIKRQAKELGFLADRKEY